MFLSYDDGIQWHEKTYGLKGHFGDGIDPGIGEIMRWKVLQSKVNLTDNYLRFKVKAENCVTQSNNSSLPNPVNVTAEKVVTGYLTAIGGVEKINNIKDITMDMSASFQGMALTVEKRKKTPDKLTLEVKINGAMVIQKQILMEPKEKPPEWVVNKN